MFGQCCAHLGQHSIAVFCLNLIRLGQHNLKANRRRVEQFQDVSVDRFHSVARIDQNKGTA